MTLSLRKFQTRDIPALFSWFSSERDALLWAGAALTWPLNRREFVKLIRQHTSKDPIREVWAVEQNGEMVAHFQLSFNRRLQTVGIGRIAIAPERRGQGLSEPFMDLILQRAFAALWVHRVDLLVYSVNDIAQHVYARAGFTLEGTRRETTPLGDELWDTHVMSILRYEFDKRTERE